MTDKQDDDEQAKDPSWNDLLRAAQQAGSSHEPPANYRQFAVNLASLNKALVDAGFTNNQALTLCKVFLATTLGGTVS